MFFLTKCADRRRFAAKAFFPLVHLRGEPPGEQLDGQAPAGFALNRLEHDSHPPAPQLADEIVITHPADGKILRDRTPQAFDFFVRLPVLQRLDHRKQLANLVGLADRMQTVVGSLSHGEQRQLEVAMARASNPRLMMLDEPASGLSRGERVALTELLLQLDPTITLILIEHDMDVALRVAERVTMMHDGRVIVEGTPDEIRANQTVNDLYLGRGGGGE